VVEALGAARRAYRAPLRAERRLRTDVQRHRSLPAQRQSGCRPDAGDEPLRIASSRPPLFGVYAPLPRAAVPAPSAGCRPLPEPRRDRSLSPRHRHRRGEREGRKAAPPRGRSREAISQYCSRNERRCTGDGPSRASASWWARVG
jgi:hypothetical protein